ncbi:hypothetical protein MO867_19995 [Microbulbifer sp. OS29]|uniref:Uncharacterized protein n=1 Tax=Microbulbifer okhotskensis TaxID=2926617 RepID=A0A9X2J9G3_9GAMM|nr:hypothetical protein [Microbulbifer okhotskensis]MCO1336616.1 hypothetical protein [Microbulbifer okhotskensis]
MNWLATLVLTFIAFVIVVWVMMHLRKPSFRMDRGSFVKGLEDVITGQASDAEWRALLACPMRHDPELEKIRQRCLNLEDSEYTGEPPYLFTEKGLQKLHEIREQLIATPQDNEPKA